MDKARPEAVASMPGGYNPMGSDAVQYGPLKFPPVPDVDGVHTHDILKPDALWLESNV
jgi:hypothetical protein